MQGLSPEGWKDIAQMNASEIELPWEEPVYAIQHPDGWLVRTEQGREMLFDSAAGAKTYADTLPCNGFKIVRYS